MLKWFERIIERVLWESRLMIFLAVVAAVASALLLVIIGTYDVWLIITYAFRSFGDPELYEAFHQKALTYIIAAIDAYLIATVLLIFGIGLYELFISKIDHAENDSKSSRILVVHNLDQLKEKLAKVIIMVLIVTFFKYAIGFKYTEALQLLYLSVSILLIALAVYFTHKRPGAAAGPGGEGGH